MCSYDQDENIDHENKKLNRNVYNVLKRSLLR